MGIDRSALIKEIFVAYPDRMQSVSNFACQDRLRTAVGNILHSQYSFTAG